MLHAQGQEGQDAVHVEGKSTWRGRALCSPSDRSRFNVAQS